jgi:hypothetical protein
MPAFLWIGDDARKASRGMMVAVRGVCEGIYINQYGGLPTDIRFGKCC